MKNGRLLVVIIAFIAIPGCGKRPPALDLIRDVDLLVEATVPRRGRPWIDSQIGRGVRIADVVRRILPALPPSRYVYRIDVPRKARLTFACGIGPNGRRRPGVEFSVRVRHAGRSEIIWTQLIDPLTTPRHRRWVEMDVDLSRFAGRNVELVLETRSFEKSDDPDWAYWATPAIAGGEKAPLVIVYLVDTLRADHTNPYGYKRDTTPDLQRFARDAVVFEQAIAQASWTKPSVASLFTSLLPGRHHVIQLRDSLQVGHLTLAEILSRHGFSNGAIIANSVIYSEGTLFEQGFDLFYGMHGADDRPSKIVEAAPVVDAALRWLDRRRGLPTFLFVHTMDPHVPYTPPPPFDRKFEPHPLPDRPAADPRVDAREPADRERLMAQYDGEIAYGDREFGRFVQGLKERGLYKHSLFVFMADHGEEFQDHGGWLHGRSVFDELVRIPLIVKFPQNRHAGRRIAQQVQEVDVLPTVLEELGLPVPEPPAIVGRPLARAIRGEAADIPAISEISHRGYVAYGIRTGRDKYIERFSPQSDELYFDLVRDPFERTSRVNGDPARVRRLKAAVEAAMIPNPFRTNLRFQGGHAMQLTLQSRGWIEGLRTEGFGLQDGYEVQERRQTRIQLVSHPGKPREVSFTVRPNGAPVWMAGTLAGRPLRREQVHIARESVHPEEGPPFRLPEIESEKERVEDIFASPDSKAAGVHVWLTLANDHIIMGPFDCETCRKMEALGYVTGCNCP